VPRQRRTPIPVPVQVQVYFRDRWLCHLCHRPVILHLALKYLAEVVRARYPNLQLAYWDPRWRRDKAPLLDELGASIDHVKAFARGGAHDTSNFKAVCARCNARKSARSTQDYLREAQPWRVRGKYGEPNNWDGLSSLFVSLCRGRENHLTATERAWLAALEAHLGQP
jgi:5-methylcytosine-specific restriction endonuclease McrA